VALGAPEFAGAAHEAQAELQQANGEFCTALVEPLPATPLPARHHTARTGRDDDALRVYPVLRGLQRSGVARRDIGRLLHLAYAHGRLPGGAEYEEWLTRRAQEIGIVGVERLRQTVNEVTMLLERLVNHPVHDEIQAAARRLHEVPYSVRYAEENGASDAGRMDLLYQRNDGKWVLMDFKVDRVRTPVRPSAYEQHAQQLQRYARALHEALGVEPVLRICFLDYDGRVQVETVDAVVVP
jgi:nucleotide-binding universal stress UspA family protein